MSPYGSTRSDKDSGAVAGLIITVFCLCVLVGAVALGMWGCPKYRVYSRGMTGQADLAQQEFAKKILIEEAKAKMESAQLLAAAEVERAKGVAEANTIIGDSLKGNEAYLRYLWINGLHDGSSEIIYVPTEAQMPVLEAGRLLKRETR